jgi:hypothetical protein
VTGALSLVLLCPRNEEASLARFAPLESAFKQCCYIIRPRYKIKRIELIRVSRRGYWRAAPLPGSDLTKSPISIRSGTLSDAAAESSTRRRPAPEKNGGF